MKNNKLHIIMTAVLSAFTVLIFTGCFDPIYHSISTDVKPEKPTVSGNITSIARYNSGSEELLVVAANGGIKYKNAANNSHGSWKTFKELPFETVHNDFGSGSYKGEDILKVVADSEYIYIVTAVYGKETSLPSSFKIWSGKINDSSWHKEDWKTIKPNNSELPFKVDTSAGRKINTFFNVFFTNDYNKDNRHAYVRIGDPDATEDKYKTVKYYTLNGTEAPVEITASSAVSADGANDKSYKCINSAVVFNGTTYFFNSPVSAATDKYIYYGNGEDLYYGKPGETTFKKALSAGADIASLAATSDAILIGCGNTRTGTAGGIKKTSLDSNGVPGSELKPFTTNAIFQMQPSYMVMCLLNATPDKPELDSILYSTITFPGVGAGGNNKAKDVGLWSYYPSRGNWNRE